MAGKARNKPFREIIADPSPTPPARDPAVTRGRISAGADGRPVLEHLDGTLYSNGIETTPDEARRLGLSGAVMAFDDCGCGGYCPMTWFSSDEVARLASQEAPTIRRPKKGKAPSRQERGSLSTWTAADGSVCILAQGKVKWGHVLA